MKVKLSIKVPPSAGRALVAKVTAAYRRAVVAARPKITALVIARASTAADELAPDFAPRYKAALRKPHAVDVTAKEVTLTIDDPVVVAVERGAAAFDMKTKLLARGKPAKGGGVYADVMISHKAGTVPQAMRTAGRRAARSFGGVGELRMPAKTPGRTFTRSLNRGPISQALGTMPKKQGVEHKRGVRDDLIRKSARRSATTVSVRYTTIRRVSSNSPASSWWHPGFKARRALDDVLPGAKREIAAIIRDAVAEKKDE
jgi:hypothetical protein